MLNVAVYVRDANYNRIAQLDQVITLECVERHLGLGTWVLELPFEGAAVDALVTKPAAGIEVRQDGRTIFSGEARRLVRKRDLSGDLLTVTGWDDMQVLHVRPALPEPLTAAPPYSTSAYDTHTGAASTVLRQFINRNAGPGALAVRQWPGLTLAADPVEGPTITESARWRETLLELIGRIAPPNGMSVLVRQQAGGLVCTVRASRDRTGVELSPRSGTLEGWMQEMVAPEMTAGWAGGQGDLTAREVVQDSTTPPDRWPRRLERFVDYRSAKDTAELTSSLSGALVEGAAKESLTLLPSEDLAGRFGLDFDLGDTVSVVIDGVRSEQVASTSTVRVADGRAERTFTVGPERLTGMGALFDQLRRHGTRLGNLEGS